MRQLHRYIYQLLVYKPHNYPILDLYQLRSANRTPNTPAALVVYTRLAVNNGFVVCLEVHRVATDFHIFEILIF